MAVIANLDSAQQIELESVLNGFKKTNPNLLFKFFNQESEIRQPLQEIKKEAVGSKSLEDKVDALSRKLDLIFGNNIIVGGNIVSVDGIIKL